MCERTFQHDDGSRCAFYNWFTGGFDTPVPKEVKALLAICLCPRGGPRLKVGWEVPMAVGQPSYLGHAQQRGQHGSSDPEATFDGPDGRSHNVW